MGNVVDIDRDRIIEQMRVDSGSHELYPMTLRLTKSTYVKINMFCDSTGIKKAVLIRKLIDLGLEVLDEKT